MNHVIAAAVALAVMVGAYHLVQQSGVRKEQVRVETKGKKTDAAAKERRKAVATKPPEEIRADLRRFCVDCDPK